MSGTWAESVVTTLSWSGIPTITNGTDIPSYGWSLRQNTVAADGTVTITTIPCGGMAPTLCSGSTAYAQYQPIASWGKAMMASGFPPIVVPPATIAGTIPGGTYTEPQVSAVLGITLQDPAGPWPPCRACVGKSSCTCGGQPYTVTNPATWWTNAEGILAPNNIDNGVVTYSVLPGGATVAGATGPHPPVNYAVPTECPRGGTPAGDYSAWPGVVGLLDFYHTQQWWGASRIQSYLTSTSVTLDATAKACVIAGNVAGPNAGKPQSDARVIACVKSDGTQCGDPTDPTQSPSAPDEVGFYDGAAQSETVSGSTFKLERITLTKSLATILAETGTTRETDLAAACQQVRVKYCPPGRTCQ
jgi:hypothetical protein